MIEKLLNPSSMLHGLKVLNLSSIKTHLQDPNFTQKFISASPQISIKEALLLMAQNDILSLPIQSHTSQTQIVNVVNLLDILLYLVTEVVSAKSPNPSTSGGSGRSRRRRSSFVENEDKPMLPAYSYQKLLNPIEAVMSLDNDRESYRLATCQLSDRLYDVIVSMSKGIHRAVVLDSNNRPQFILTQMDVLRHLYKFPEAIANLNVMDKSVEELGLVIKEGGVTIVKDDLSALEAYRHMANNRYTSTVVVDRQTGKILSNLSASSLRGLSTNNLELILFPVQQFMKVSPRGIRPLVYCNLNTKFQQLLGLFVEKNVHHVWLVDDKEKPYATIAPKDILKMLIREG